jgi:hypothetical protein
MKKAFEFPDRLKIKVLDATSNRPIDKMAMMITLIAPRKNNYTHPIITQVDGIAIVLKEDVKQSVTNAQNLFLMDYASRFEECSSMVQIRILSAKEVHDAVAAMKSYKKAMTIDDQLIDRFQESQNALYEPQDYNIRFATARPEKFIRIKARRREHETITQAHEDTTENHSSHHRIFNLLRGIFTRTNQ